MVPSTAAARNLPNNGLSGGFGNQRQTYELKIAALNIDAVVNVPQGNDRPTSNGYTIFLTPQFLNYMLAGYWNVGLSSLPGTFYADAFTSGYQTPVSAVPTTGQGIYATSIATLTSVTSPPVGGNVLINEFGSTESGTVSGNATVTVDFASGAVNGSMTNMGYDVNAQYRGAWNDVSLKGTLAGANVSGTTAATSAGAGEGAFDISATGVFNGALYGPKGQELGVVWTLHDPTGLGKTAVGYIAAEKTN